MPTDTKLQEETQTAIIDLEETPEFQLWKASKLEECLRYLRLSFNLELPAEKLLFHPAQLGYPDPVRQLRSHARIWGYNYKIEGENVINPATGQLMSYVVWQILEPPVVVADLESDSETDAKFDAESTS